ncbi:MAG: archaemetzincin family Zn-dependent metalloprotease [Nitrospira sp.]|nr:archaemetzincin family Zn-dependent metalloprotease [Nitrospira sp.]MDH4305571.1 archaemetzincin family Zn-dependent metalloprotease [Nitrospira sp.]MDH5193547.1 archaemetzincin family Zn-dependent metalloprotease [Nitrospira sp.]
MGEPLIKVQILPFEETPQRDLTGLIEELASLGIEATLLPKASVVPPSYNPQRKQHNAEIFLDRVRLAPGHCILGVTNRDLYVEGLNYVFGLADSPGKAAVISLHRLHAGADDMLFRARAVKEAVHELGHTRGLRHCADSRCVMAFSNSLADIDRKGKEFCVRCTHKFRGH